KSLLESFNSAGPLADFTFETAPAIDVSGSFNLATPRHLKIIGHAAVPKFSYQNVPLNDLAADFSWDGERILVRDLRVNQQEGQLKAALLNAPGDFRLTVDSTVNPIVLKGFLS